ncbi:hypothetical protein CRENBAI_005354 [Crenichthys baileyi]|uniref:Uncharacterized protein n=1 Tax=Crenichthys baileyi TaxID=28760 RepID=A0AAV9SN50_9TELE
MKREKETSPRIPLFFFLSLCFPYFSCLASRRRWEEERGNVEASGWILEEIMRHGEWQLQRSMLPATCWFSPCCGYYGTVSVLKQADRDRIKRLVSDDKYEYLNYTYGFLRLKWVRQNAAVWACMEHVG